VSDLLIFFFGPQVRDQLLQALRHERELLAEALDAPGRPDTVGGATVPPWDATASVAMADAALAQLFARSSGAGAGGTVQLTGLPSAMALTALEEDGGAAGLGHS